MITLSIMRKLNLFDTLARLLTLAMNMDFAMHEAAFILKPLQKCAHLRDYEVPKQK